MNRNDISEELLKWTFHISTLNHHHRNRGKPKPMAQNRDHYQLFKDEETRIRAQLRERFVGKSIDDADLVRTPALIIDRGVFEANCAGMMKKAREWGAEFRAHLKTHKTTEGTRHQLQTSEGSTGAVVVSTVKEAWEVWNAGLVEDGVVRDILYGLPVGVNKVSDLAGLWDKMQPYGGIVRLLVDHLDQVKLLENFENKRETKRRWSVFVKINGGQNRAGVPPSSEELRVLLEAILRSPATSLHGFYAHAGNSYASTSKSEATSYLSSEVQIVNEAAAFALSNFGELLKSAHRTEPFVLSVGSTPTAHASGAEAKEMLDRALHGKLELHAGNYPMLDLQQQHTTLIDYPRIAQRVRTTVISYYPGRGKGGEDEALIDAGAIAFSKDTGPSGSFGEVVGKPWKLARISQEHGVLSATTRGERLEVGSTVDIVGQHACLIAAAHPWFYVVDSTSSDSSKIVDIWVPWKGW
ncbi:hypothetical protein CC2G_001282 [Coprinopsis cinerea AmutBmut pab1-1]|nr:hypothetical protein CC2G_001282 [Coprinopsis cinerea AmutBmut pab1-1]